MLESIVRPRWIAVVLAFGSVCALSRAGDADGHGHQQISNSSSSSEEKFGPESWYLEAGGGGLFILSEGDEAGVIGGQPMPNGVGILGHPSTGRNTSAYDGSGAFFLRGGYRVSSHLSFEASYRYLGEFSSNASFDLVTGFFIPEFIAYLQKERDTMHSFTLGPRFTFYPTARWAVSIGAGANALLNFQQITTIGDSGDVAPDGTFFIVPVHFNETTWKLAPYADLRIAYAVTTQLNLGMEFQFLDLPSHIDRQAGVIGLSASYQFGKSPNDADDGLARWIEPKPASGNAWYAEHEWNLGLWSTYVFTREPRGSYVNFDQGLTYLGDHYLGGESAWGGGLDIKYFLCRYVGIGLEGDALHATRRDEGRKIFRQFTREETRVVGSVLGTITLRVPLGDSRLAPFVFAGGGRIFGGGERNRVIPDPQHSFQVLTIHSGSKSEPAGQFGGGLEVRLTPHIGLTSDFSWNVINGSQNNFRMVRAGLNIAF
ncbi:MAG: hypothetical protein M3128_05005 [Verrucomicrobiota bacterium]|nr:hypothetical protein [Verrucomicrobiota bacterium]